MIMFLFIMAMITSGTIGYFLAYIREQKNK